MVNSIKEQNVDTFFCTAASRVGLMLNDVHLPLVRIKQQLDPQNLANPGRIVDIPRTEKDLAKLGKSLQENR